MISRSPSSTTLDAKNSWNGFHETIIRLHHFDLHSEHKHYYADLASVRSEHSVCRGLFMISVVCEVNRTVFFFKKQILNLKYTKQ